MPDIERILSSRDCSVSGRATANGGCAGSKTSLAAAVKRRLAKYEKANSRSIQDGQPLCPTLSLSRRQFLHAGGAATGLGLASARAGQAVSLPSAFDGAWSAVGGGPADLAFPEDFLGIWMTESTLIKVETPLGLDFVPNLENLQRALKEDLQNRIRYEVAYIRNRKGQIVIDRQYNIRSLMNLYMGRNAITEDSVKWNPNDPNKLSIRLPGGGNIVTRVVRRSEEKPGKDRVNTSEFFEQVFQYPNRPEPKVKASQCFTKYKFRSQTEAAQSGGAQIVATQVVSDYLTPYDGEGMMLKAKNRPVAIFTYSMSFRKTNKLYSA